MRFLFVVITGVLMVNTYAHLVEADDFFDAYQKEYAFLEAEKMALKKRLDAVDGEASIKEEAARQELQNLQSRLLAIHNKADAIELDLDETERDNSDMEERKDMLIETMSRAAETLERYGFELAAPSENVDVQATQIVNIFKAAVTAHDMGSHIAVDDGSFFLINGKKVNGKILTVGHIAAYGVSEGGSGVLAPAGGGKYKLWNTATGSVAEQLLSGRFPRELPIFLYESMEKPVEHKEEKTWKEIVDSGGIIAWIIVGLGIVALFMVLARIGILTVAGLRTDKLIKTVSELVNRGELDKALSKCKRAKGAASHVLKVTIENLHKDREKLDDIVSEAILHKAPMVERFNTSILVAASVAPLLGLLGTVTGMISTFDIITEYGTGDPKMLSGGISEALVTTELGLIVAIPTLLFGTLLSGRAGAIMDAMERAALQVINVDDMRSASGSNEQASDNSKQPPESTAHQSEKGDDMSKMDDVIHETAAEATV